MNQRPQLRDHELQQQQQQQQEQQQPTLHHCLQDASVPPTNNIDLVVGHRRHHNGRPSRKVSTSPSSSLKTFWQRQRQSLCYCAECGEMTETSSFWQRRSRRVCDSCFKTLVGHPPTSRHNHRRSSFFGNNNNNNQEDEDADNQVDDSGSASGSTTYYDGQQSRSKSRTRNNNNNEVTTYSRIHCCHNKATSTKQQTEERTSPAVWVIRMVFVVCLAGVAVLLSTFAYYMVSNSEHDLAEQQWAALADRALDLAKELAVRRRVVVKSMSQIASSAFPTANVWPNVAIPAFTQIAHDLSLSSSTTTVPGNNNKNSRQEVSFHPLVIPELQNNNNNETHPQQSSFEAFAYDYFYNTLNLPNGTALHSFGRGIWKTQQYTTGSLYIRVRDNTGTTNLWNSSRRVLFPELQNSEMQGSLSSLSSSSSQYHPSTSTTTEARLFLMHNVHSEETKGRPLDQVMACTEQRQRDRNLDMDCGVATDITSWNRDSFLIQPIYPAKDPFHFTGVIIARVSWDSLIQLIFQDSLSAAIGLTLTLTTSEGKTYSYSIDQDDNDNGGPTPATFIGEGDLHDTRYTSHVRSIHLSGTVLSGSSSRESYTLAIYPTQHFFDYYSTQNPWIAMIGALVIVAITSIIFFGYDFVVQREFNAKQQLLQAKRHFMRFISHEVRTPLNAVCLGLALLHDEMKELILSMRDDHEQEEEQGNSYTTTTTTISKSNINSSGKSRRLEQLELSLEGWLTLTQEITESADSSVDVLNDLLDYDKIQLGSYLLEFTIFPISRLVHDTSREFRLSAKKKNIRFTIYNELSDDNSHNTTNEANQALRVVADRIRLTQVLRNLVSNALKFTPEGGDLSIRTSMLPCKNNSHRIDKYMLKSGEKISLHRIGKVNIDVTDTGVGLSEEQLNSLFQEGTQFNVNELQAGKGSGLGLFISKGMVQKHGGELKAVSEGLGRGSTFTVSLPVYDVPDDPVATDLTFLSQASLEYPGANEYDGASAIAEEDVSGVASCHFSLASSGNNAKDIEAQRPLRILVVDDVASNRKLVSRMARNRKHYVDEASDGQEAVEKVATSMQQEEPYDTILMDYEMPILNGPDAVKKIRAMGCKSLVVGITGNVLAEDVSHFISSGSDYVLPKPVKFHKLEEMWLERGIVGQISNELDA